MKLNGIGGLCIDIHLERNRGQQGSFGKAAKEQDPEVTVQFLDDYAETQWEVSRGEPS